MLNKHFRFDEMRYLTEAFSEQACPLPFCGCRGFMACINFICGAPFVCVTRVHKHDLLMQKALDSLVDTCDTLTAVGNALPVCNVLTCHRGFYCLSFLNRLEGRLTPGELTTQPRTHTAPRPCNRSGVRSGWNP